MSDEIKVGDVCVIVSPANTDLIGQECEVVGEEKVYEKTIAKTDGFEVIAWCNGFMVRLACNGRRYCLARECLRKKKPPADDSQWIREETVPLERFNEWRETVRRREKIEEPA